MSERRREVRDVLERLEGKLSRAVLRGLGGSNALPATRLLEKWGRQCAYCKKTDCPLEIEHLIPRSRSGSDRVSNLTLACHECNQAKGARTAAEFGYPELQVQAKAPLRDVAAVNATRWVLFHRLQALGLPLETGNGRTNQVEPKSPVSAQDTLARRCLRRQQHASNAHHQGSLASVH